MSLFGHIATALLAFAPLVPWAFAQTPSADFFVSPEGNDSWSGKLAAPNSVHTDGPFASIARAQAALRDLRKAEPNHARTVMLRGGTYYLASSPTRPGTLSFSAFDAATNTYPTTWQNYPGETPVISGGLPAGKGWKHVAGALWQVQLPADTKPFEYLFYNGERRLRARLQSASGTGYSMRGGTCYSTESKAAVEKSLCNLGTYLRMAAEVPSTGANTGCPAVARNDRPSTAKCLDRFVYDPHDPIANWINLHPNDTSCPPASGHAKDYPVGDIELTLFNATTVDIMRVSCVDTHQRVIYFSAGARGDSVHYDGFGPSAGRRYMIENVKDAFDAAAAGGQTGLWFLDRSTTPWTLDYLANAGENPNNDSVVIAQVPPVRTAGASLLSAVYLDCVTFRGITFEVDNFVPSPLGFNAGEISDDTLPEAIECVSCEDVTFDGVTVRHTSASGILLTSGSGDVDRPPFRNKVLNSALYDMGDCGIRVGTHPRSSDRSNHVVQFVTIENNVVRGYSRVFASGIGISMADGHDVTILHNDVSDGYNSGLSVCLLGCPAHDANGFNITAQYNLIRDVIEGVMDRGAAIYFDTGSPNGTGAGNKIASNVAYNVSGGDGIFLDDKSAAIDVENNVIFNLSGSAVTMREGPAKGYPGNTFRNNIFARARESMFQFPSPWSPEGCGEKQLRVSLTNNIFYFDRNEKDGFQVMRGCTYSCGLDYDQFEKFQGNLYWRSGGGLSADAKMFHIMTQDPANAARCAEDAAGGRFLSFAQWQAMKEDVSGTASVDPGFGKSGQPRDYLISRDIPGFDKSKTNDAIAHAGRDHAVIMPPKVAQTFPTYPMREF